MSIAAAQADAFFKEVVVSKEVWAICDEGGFAAPKNSSGERAMPFWSKESRALAIIKGVQAYRVFRPECIPLDEFIQEWLPDLEQDGVLIGINWSGTRATGYDMKPRDVSARLAVMLANGS